MEGGGSGAKRVVLVWEAKPRVRERQDSVTENKREVPD